MSADSLADTSVTESVPGTPDGYKEKRRSIHNQSQLTLSARTVVHEHNNSLIVEVIPDPELETGMEPEQEAALEPDHPSSPEDQSQCTHIEYTLGGGGGGGGGANRICLEGGAKML